MLVYSDYLLERMKRVGHNMDQPEKFPGVRNVMPLFLPASPGQGEYL